MKITEKIKQLFRRKPRTPEQLAARAEAEARMAAAQGDGTQSALNQTGQYTGY
jgi:hypothetical protein